MVFFVVWFGCVDVVVFCVVGVGDCVVVVFVEYVFFVFDFELFVVLVLEFCYV